MGSDPAYRRVLLKMSGEALAGGGRSPLDASVLSHVVTEIASAQRRRVEVAVVTGGGNFLRGATADALGIGRVAADQIGMLGTISNALALASALERAGLGALVLSAIEARGVVDLYRPDAADFALKRGEVVLLAGGTGSPFFSTDTAAALRAAELGADALLKATKVDGVYDSDPVKNPVAKRFEELGYREVLDRSLGVMDLTAVTLCMENSIPIVVFNLFDQGALERLLAGERVGTRVGALQSR